MDSRIRCEMSQSESLIMEYLWKNDEGKCFSEIMEYLNGELQKNWKKQTINTFIRHLIDKGLVTAEATQKSRRYHAALTPVQFARGKANNYYGGSVQTFLSALTGGKQLSKELADELQKMVETEIE